MVCQLRRWFMKNVNDFCEVKVFYYIFGTYFDDELFSNENHRWYDDRVYAQCFAGFGFRKSVTAYLSEVWRLKAQLVAVLPSCSFFSRPECFWKENVKGMFQLEHSITEPELMYKVNKVRRNWRLGQFMKTYRFTCHVFIDIINATSMTW